MIRPLNRSIVVLPVKKPETSPGGIALPQISQGNQQGRGEVVAVGSKSKVSVGDQVLFPSFSGVEIDFNGHNYLVLREKELLAVLK